MNGCDNYRQRLGLSEIGNSPDEQRGSRKGKGKAERDQVKSPPTS
jgi:hypothetical protein